MRHIFFPYRELWCWREDFWTKYFVEIYFSVLCEQHQIVIKTGLANSVVQNNRSMKCTEYDQHLQTGTFFCKQILNFPDWF